MNLQDTKRKINQLKFENLLSVIFIALSVLNIYGDDLLQRFVILQDKKDEKRAKEVFLVALIITVLIYFYFTYRNYKELKDAIKNGDSDVFAHRIRVFGTLLLIIGVCCFIYFNRNSGETIDDLPPL